MSTPPNAADRPRSGRVYENTSPEAAEATLCRRRAAIKLADTLISECSGPRAPSAIDMEFVDTLMRRYSTALVNEQAARVGVAIGVALQSVGSKKAEA